LRRFISVAKDLPHLVVFAVQRLVLFRWQTSSPKQVVDPLPDRISVDAEFSKPGFPALSSIWCRLGAVSEGACRMRLRAPPLRPSSAARLGVRVKRAEGAAAQDWRPTDDPLRSSLYTCHLPPSAALAAWVIPPLGLTRPGRRVSYADGTATVTDRPFAEAKEAIGGYWIIQVRSREEALEWARRAPMANNEIIEVRQIYERADFSIVVQKEAVQKAAEGFEELSNAAAAKA
jgi:hypothetical protein